MPGERGSPKIEQARAKLHATLKPTHGLLPGEALGCSLNHLALPEGYELCSCRNQSPFDLSLLEVWAEIGARHSVYANDFSRLTLEEMIGRERRSNRSAGIACGRLNPDVLKSAVPQHFAISNAIQRHPAGQAQIFRAGFLRKAPRQSQNRFVEHRLDRGRNVHVKLRQQLFRGPHRLAEQSGKAVVS
jgi:hypothetical protein